MTIYDRDKSNTCYESLVLLDLSLPGGNSRDNKAPTEFSNLVKALETRYIMAADIFDSSCSLSSFLSS